MESILHLKHAIEDLELKETEWEDKSLSKNEWKLLEGAVKLLQPFRETNTLSGLDKAQCTKIQSL